MPETADQEPLLRLLHSGAGAGALRRLLDTHGSAGAAVAAGAESWRTHGLESAACAAIRQPDRDLLARSRRWLAADAHALIGWRDADYPLSLRDIQSPPVALFVSGEPAMLWRPSIAVVGSRMATAGGRANAGAFAAALAHAGLCVASGLAAGIDASAHRATLDAGGATVAVLGTGPDIAYPRANRTLMTDIAASGALVSEHPPGTPPLRPHFPGRNRILAGLSLATLVVEAAQRSGALITARMAAEAGREVFVVPGSIHNPMARGCHRLIREGAALVESPGEILDTLATQIANLAGIQRRTLQADPSDCACPPHWAEQPDYNILWEAMGYDPTCMDELVLRTGLTAARVSSMLLALELDGQVAVEHGRFSRRRVPPRA